MIDYIIVGIIAGAIIGGIISMRKHMKGQCCCGCGSADKKSNKK